jgi:pyruvate/2-oxoglutarate dehydrogenase complex dihydrolipoamide acyltransferase (E2) component
MLAAPPAPEKTIMQILEGLEKAAIIEKDGTQAEYNKARALAETGGMQINAVDTIGQLMLALKAAQQPPPEAPPAQPAGPMPAAPSPAPEATAPMSPFAQHFTPPETVQ